MGSERIRNDGVTVESSCGGKCLGSVKSERMGLGLELGLASGDMDTRATLEIGHLRTGMESVRTCFGRISLSFEATDLCEGSFESP